MWEADSECEDLSQVSAKDKSCIDLSSGAWRGRTMRLGQEVRERTMQLGSAGTRVT